MNFNLGLENAQVSSTAGNYFKPYTINKIDTIKVEKKSGDKKDGGKWVGINVTYSNSETNTSVSKTYFSAPNDQEGITRGVYNGQPCFPAPYEVIKQLAVHILGIYNPAAFEKFKKYVTKIKTMDQFVDGFIKLTNESPKNSSLYVKVIGKNSQGKIYSDIPSPCAVSKNREDGKYTHINEAGQEEGNDIYPINFLSTEENGLTFNPTELKKQAEYAKAKPTTMPDTKTEENLDEVEGDSDLDSINIDDELGDLSID